VRRRGDRRCGEAAAFLGLRRRVVDLGHAQAFDRLGAIGESVEAGAEDDDLPHAARDRAPRRILGEAAAGGDIEAQAARGRIGARLGDRGVGVRAENTQGQRVANTRPPSTT
jgi:hypothetical protein